MKHYARKTITALTALLLIPSASAFTYNFSGAATPEQYHQQSGTEVITEGCQIPASNKATALPMALPSTDAGMMYNLIGVSVNTGTPSGVVTNTGGTLSGTVTNSDGSVSNGARPTTIPTISQGGLSGGVSSGDSFTHGGVTSVPLSDGCVGSLEIEAVGLSCKVYQGESTESMEKGAGHIESTSMWDGNVALCGHNRGSHAHFAKLKNVEVGDIVTYTTSLGTRRYEVVSATKISVDNLAVLDNTTRNTLTLLTCVANTPSKRLCVVATEIS